MVRFGQQRYATAFDRYRRLVEIVPDGAQAHANLGATLERRYVTSCGPSHAVLIVLALLPVARITYRPCRRRVARPRFIGLGERETLKSAVAPGSRSALRLFAAVDAGRCGSAGPRTAGLPSSRSAPKIHRPWRKGRR